MYISRINNSFNKIKTIWNIIKEETNKAQGTTNIILNNCQNSSETFNRYFLSIPQNIINDIRINTNQSACIAKNPNYYLFNLFHAPFPSIKPQNTSTKEWENYWLFKNELQWLWWNFYKGIKN